MASSQERFSAGSRVTGELSQVDADSKRAADNANVSKPAYINYEAALLDYSQRSDIESFNAYRSRHFGHAEGIPDQKWARHENPVANEPQDGGTTTGTGTTGG